MAVTPVTATITAWASPAQAIPEAKRGTRDFTIMTQRVQSVAQLNLDPCVAEKSGNETAGERRRPLFSPDTSGGSGAVCQ